MGKTEKELYPFISVVVPVRNEEKIIERCLQALLHLNYPKDRYEILVADGCSTDKTREIAQRYGARVLNNEGRSRAMGVNVGIENASGDYIAFTDADCVADTNWLKNSLKYFVDDKVAGVGGPNIVPDGTKPFIKAIEFVSFQTPTALTLKTPGEVRSIAGCNAVYRAEVLKKFHPLPQIGYIEDTLLNHRIRKAGFKLLSAPDAVVWHHRHYSSYRSFFRQMFLYGKGLVQAARLHKELRNALHILEIFSLPIALALAAILYFISWPAFLAFIGLGIASLLFFSAKCLWETKSPAVAMHVPPVIITQALGYLTGYIAESVSPLIRVRERGR